MTQTPSSPDGMPPVPLKNKKQTKMGYRPSISPAIKYRGMKTSITFLLTSMGVASTFSGIAYFVYDILDDIILGLLPLASPPIFYTFLGLSLVIGAVAGYYFSKKVWDRPSRVEELQAVNEEIEKRKIEIALENQRLQAKLTRLKNDGMTLADVAVCQPGIGTDDLPSLEGIEIPSRPPVSPLTSKQKVLYSLKYVCVGTLVAAASFFGILMQVDTVLATLGMVGTLSQLPLTLLGPIGAGILVVSLALGVLYGVYKVRQNQRKRECESGKRYCDALDKQLGLIRGHSATLEIVLRTDLWKKQKEAEKRLPRSQTSGPTIIASGGLSGGAKSAPVENSGEIAGLILGDSTSRIQASP